MIGVLLRREGLYSTQLSEWRRQRDRGALDALGVRRRSRKPDPSREWRERIAQLESENERPQERLQAEAIIIISSSEVSIKIPGRETIGLISRRPTADAQAARAAR